MMEEMQVDKRIIKTKNKLKTALVSLLQTKKIDEVSILELTELANINRKTFYLHYKSIPDVLKDIENSVINELRRVVGTLELKIDTIDQYIYGVFNVILQDKLAKTLIQKTNYYKVIFYSLEKILIDDCERRYKIENEFSSAPLKYTIAHHVFGTTRLFCHWLRKDTNEDLHMFSNFIGELVLKGVAGLFKVR